MNIPEITIHAEWFANLNADQRVEFLRRVDAALEARARALLPDDTNYGPRLEVQRQWSSIGSHAQNCTRCRDAAVLMAIIKMAEGAIVGTGQ